MYIGRFAPSPTGPLHRGSLATALASYIDARVHRGKWFVRIEDVDHTRARSGVAEEHLRNLEALGFEWDGPVIYQRLRNTVYLSALQKINELCYPCYCSRAQIAAHQNQNQCLCRSSLREHDKAASIRLALPSFDTHKSDELASFNGFTDRWFGSQVFDLRASCGDFVLRRADGVFSYQLAVVVDDAAQGITQVVRGSDLIDNTPRQRWLNFCLGFSQPGYAHIPTVNASDGKKLSKQNGALALNMSEPVEQLNQAMLDIGLAPLPVGTVQEFWKHALDEVSVKQFTSRFHPISPQGKPTF